MMAEVATTRAFPFGVAISGAMPVRILLFVVYEYRIPVLACDDEFPDVRNGLRGGAVPEFAICRSLEGGELPNGQRNG